MSGIGGGRTTGLNKEVTQLYLADRLDYGLNFQIGLTYKSTSFVGSFTIIWE